MADKEKKSTKQKTAPMTAAKAAAPKTMVKRATARSKAGLGASHEEIATLAHRFWTERGGKDGNDTEDWLRAERELLGKAS